MKYVVALLWTLQIRSGIKEQVHRALRSSDLVHRLHGNVQTSKNVSNYETGYFLASKPCRFYFHELYTCRKRKASRLINQALIPSLVFIIGENKCIILHIDSSRSCFHQWDRVNLFLFSHIHETVTSSAISTMGEEFVDWFGFRFGFHCPDKTLKSLWNLPNRKTLSSAAIFRIGKSDLIMTNQLNPCGLDTISNWTLKTPLPLNWHRLNLHCQPFNYFPMFQFCSNWYRMV